MTEAIHLPPRPSATARAAAVVVDFGFFALVVGVACSILMLGTSVSVLAAVVAGVVGAAAAAVRPMRFPLARMPAGPAIVRGQPVPLMALGYTLAKELERPLVTSVRLAVVVGLGLLIAVLGAYEVAGASPSLVSLGVVSLASYLAAIACAACVPPFLLDERTRRAFAAFDWAGAREFERAFGSKRAAIGFPTDAEQARSWLEKQSPRPIRSVDVEAIVLTGDLDAARAAADGLPATTPYERFVREDGAALLRYQLNGDTDLSAARRALLAIPDGRERLEATTALAVGEARQQLPDGDWRQPLLAVRDLIPEGDARILLRDHGSVTFATLILRLWPVLGVLVGVVVGVVVLSYLV
jgi:hypothetical protein